ncbi:unnamed protein product [Closterium sp. NIES-54]
MRASVDSLNTADGEADGWRILFWAKPGDNEGASLPSPQPFKLSTFQPSHSPRVLIQHRCAGCRSATADTSVAAANGDKSDSTSGGDDPWEHAAVLRAYTELNGRTTTQEAEEGRGQRCEENALNPCVCVREAARVVVWTAGAGISRRGGRHAAPGAAAGTGSAEGEGR